MEYTILILFIAFTILILYFATKFLHKLMNKRYDFYKMFSIVLIAVFIPLLAYLISSEVINYWSQPTDEDRQRLGEMTTKVIYSEDFKKLEKTRIIYSIEPSVNRYNRQANNYLYDVYVKTDKETYGFNCDDLDKDDKDQQCKIVDISSWGYSEYSEEQPFFNGYRGYKNGLKR